MTYHKRWRLIKKVTPPKAKALLGIYGVPVEAASLAEDIARLEVILHLLGKIDSANITATRTQADRDYGQDMLKSQIALVESWHRSARLKLREFLAP
jgi:hypothetical protein